MNMTIRRRGRGRLPSGKPHPVDVHVGARLRQRRTLLGMSQGKLGEAIGLTFQQVQKYERGANRIGSSRLYELSRILDVKVEYFFEELEPETVRAQVAAGGLPDDVEPYEADPMTKRETLELVRAYYKITDPKVRKRLFEMAKAFAANAEIGSGKK